MQKSIAAELAEAVALNHDLEARLAQSEQALKDANKTSETAGTALAESIVQLTAANEQITSRDMTIAAREAQIVQLTARVNELEVSAKTAGQQAGEILANVSASPIEGASAGQVRMSKAELWEHYRTMQPSEKFAFYQANQKEMDAK